MRQLQIAICLLNFGLIGVLPLLFFARGRFNWRWWTTASPFFLAGILLALALLTGSNASLWMHPSAGLWITSITLNLMSISLIVLAMNSHQERVSLWHQDDALPAQIVTVLAYRHIRHPLYLAFSLAFFGATTAIPSVPMLLVSISGILAMNITARLEEQHLLESAHGPQYRAYMARTGRLLPRWRLP